MKLAKAVGARVAPPGNGKRFDAVVERALNRVLWRQRALKMATAVKSLDATDVRRK